MSESSNESTHENKETAPRASLKDIFKGISGALLSNSRVESHELPQAPGIESTPYAFHLPLEAGMTKLALRLDQDTEMIKRADAIYSQAHTSPDIPGLVIPPEILIDVHVHVLLPEPESPPIGFIPPTALDKHLIYCVQQISEDEYIANVSIDYSDPRYEMDYDSYIPEERMDTELLRLETMLYSAEELDSPHSLTYKEAMQLLRSPMRSHDLEEDERAHLEAILGAIKH